MLTGCDLDFKNKTSTPSSVDQTTTIETNTSVDNTNNDTTDQVDDATDQNTDDTAPLAAAIYLRGQVTDPVWDYTELDNQFKYIGNNQYELVYELAAQGYEFKIADANWSMDYGAAATNALDLDAVFAMQSSGGNITITVAEAGFYRFVFDVTDQQAPLLTVSATTFEDIAPYGDVVSVTGDLTESLAYLGKGFYQTELSLAVGDYQINLAGDTGGFGTTSAVSVDTDVALQSGTDPVQFSITQAGHYNLVVNASESAETPSFKVAYLGAPNQVKVHYQRCLSNDYADWEIHLWGSALTDEQVSEWGQNPEFVSGETDAYGYVLSLPVEYDIQPFSFIVHKNGTKDVTSDRSIIPVESPEIWLRQNDPNVYTAAPERNDAEYCVAKAFAGHDVVAGQNLPVRLNAFGSDVAADYQWTLLSAPEGSNAIFSASDAIFTDFTADLVGEYQVELTINQGTAFEQKDDVLVTVKAVQSVKNVIIMIGDGMGYEQVKGARYYAGQPLAFESMPYQGVMQTASASSIGREDDAEFFTDSAAAATAMATGIKVANNVISLEEPGDRHELETILEFMQKQQKSVGLVTTTFMTHATPAGFGAHELQRSSYDEIGQDYFTQTKPNVLFGGGGNGVTPAMATDAGYTVVETKAALMDYVANASGKPGYISAQFGLDHLPYMSEWADKGTTYPTLSEMSTAALDILDNDESGFLLMIEGGRIDHAGHGNDLQNNVLETVEFSNTAQAVLNWAQGRDDTLIILTADHECGGLTITQDNGAGEIPEGTWTTGNHTNVNVPIYSWGVNGDLINGVTVDNTDVYHIIRAAVQ